MSTKKSLSIRKFLRSSPQSETKSDTIASETEPSTPAPTSSTPTTNNVTPKTPPEGTRKSKSSFWANLKAENEQRKAKSVQYVSPQEAEALTGYGAERVKREDEERKKYGMTLQEMQDIKDGKTGNGTRMLTKFVAGGLGASLTDGP